MTHVSPETSIASSRNAASSTLPSNLTLALVVIAAAQLMVVLDAQQLQRALAPETTLGCGIGCHARDIRPSERRAT